VRVGRLALGRIDGNQGVGGVGSRLGGLMPLPILAASSVWQLNTSQLSVAAASSRLLQKSNGGLCFLERDVLHCTLELLDNEHQIPLRLFGVPVDVSQTNEPGYVRR